MAMVRHRAAHSSTVDTRLLVSARSGDDVLYRDELVRLAAGDGLAVHQTFTREPPAAVGLRAAGRRGRADRRRACARASSGCCARSSAIAPEAGLVRDPQRHVGPSRERAVELGARADAELGEDLVQVVLDGARADEQPGADLRVGEAVAGEPRDLRLLGGERRRGSRRVRLRAVSPVASSSRAARSANASMPIAVNISWAVRSCSRASRRRRSRRSHSP